MAKEINNFLIPQVNKVSQDKKIESNKIKSGEKSEFSQLMESTQASNEKSDGVNISSHAAKRLYERNIDFNGDEYMKVKDAIGKLKAKGGQESLVITSKAAYVVDVKNSKIITAVDKNNMAENVFTKIDSTVFVN
jgi:flagellar operon protein